MNFKNFFNPSSQALSIFAVGVLGSLSHVDAQSLAITNTISNTVGTSGLIPGSGTADNTTDWAIGTVGVFEINNGDYFMRVTATNAVGGMKPEDDSLMVIRTENSQGLTDTGTLSVYARPTPANASWSLDLNFSFFTDSGLTTAAPISNMMLTSLDIDFNQRYFTSDSTFSSSQTYSTMGGSTAITTPVSVPAGYTGFTSAGDATFNNPRYAVSSTGTGSSFDIKIAHNNVALYMFEFRNPSSIVVPEPTSALLILGTISMFSMIRRRRQVA